MKKLLVFLSMVVMLFGFSGDDIWEENGNLKEEHAREMQEAWCDYNEGREFVTDQCDYFKKAGYENE